VGVQVDVARGDDHPVGVEHLVGVRWRQPADGGDAAVLDPQVGSQALGPGAIDDGAAGDDGVVRGHRDFLP
jgi:hypothetical protein